jgi:hypothetical protein
MTPAACTLSQTRLRCINKAGTERRKVKNMMIALISLAAPSVSEIAHEDHRMQ